MPRAPSSSGRRASPNGSAGRLGALAASGVQAEDAEATPRARSPAPAGRSGSSWPGAWPAHQGPIIGSSRERDRQAARGVRGRSRGTADDQTASLYFDAEPAIALGASWARGESLMTRSAHSRAEDDARWRVVRFAPLDVHDDSRPAGCAGRHEPSARGGGAGHARPGGGPGLARRHVPRGRPRQTTRQPFAVPGAWRG